MVWPIGHVCRMPQERLTKQALFAKVIEKRPVEDHKHAGKSTFRISVGITHRHKQVLKEDIF